MNTVTMNTPPEIMMFDPRRHKCRQGHGGGPPRRVVSFECFMVVERVSGSQSVIEPGYNLRHTYA